MTLVAVAGMSLDIFDKVASESQVWMEKMKRKCHVDVAKAERNVVKVRVRAGRVQDVFLCTPVSSASAV